MRLNLFNSIGNDNNTDRYKEGIDKDMPQITLTDNTVRKILSDHHLTGNKIEKIIAEYIWNGFDAEATVVEVLYSFAGSDFGGEPSIRELIIKDNGKGIDFFKLGTKFTPFYDSEKALLDVEERHHSTIHGKNGIGRLSFASIAWDAKWNTVFSNNGKRLKYTITIADKEIGEYNAQEEKLIETKGNLGTTVELTNFKRLTNLNSGYKPLELKILDFLKREFGWYLELNKAKNFKLLINGIPIDYADHIEDCDEREIKYQDSEFTFKVRYVQWNNPLADEASMFYYINSEGNEVYKETTGLNKKGDNFYHSVYVQSQYFDNVNLDLPWENRMDNEYKFIKKELNDYLKRKRKTFLRVHSSRIISKYEDEGIIDKKNKSRLELIEIEDLETVLQEIYIIEPQVLSDLSPKQIKTLIGLLRLILNSDEREYVIQIIEQVVELEQKDRKKLCDILRVTDLNRIIKTMDLIVERLKVLKLLNEIIFKPEYGANERDHLQKIVELNYWIFGEEYNLVSYADADFEKALRNHLYIIRGIDKKAWMIDPNKRDRADIFLCRQDKCSDSVHNVLVELKHPTDIKLGEKELSQVMRYMQIIIDEPQFNADSYTWDFYLVGSKFDKSKYIENVLESSKSKGVPGLAYEVGNFRIFVKKWSDILSQCELRHNFINNRLEVKKEKLIESFHSADEAVQMAQEASMII